MKAFKFILTMMISVLFSGIVGAAAGPAAGVGVFVASTMSKSVSTLPMAVAPEIWTEYIVENLFKNSEWVFNSIDESQYVIGGTVVHIPQAGNPSRAVRNRTQLPATITRRQDVDITYALDEFTTDPRFIPNIDEAQLSYDKMDSCMSEDMSYLEQLAADWMLYNWRSTYFLPTTGDAVDATVGTGQRNKITVADFEAAKKTFNRWLIPDADRFVIISTDMLAQITAELRANSNRDYSVIYDPKTGKIDKLESFKIYETSSLIASNYAFTQQSNKLYKWTGGTDLTYTPDEVYARTMEDADEAFATTSCEMAYFWHKNGVARAMGDTKMFDDEGNPTYFGDIYSFLKRGGGRARRADGKGVLGVIQAIPE